MKKPDEDTQSNFYTRIIGDASAYANKTLTMMRLLKMKLIRSKNALSMGFDFVSSVMSTNNELELSVARSSLNFVVSGMINNKLTFPFASYHLMRGSTAISKIMLTDVTTNLLWRATPFTKKSMPTTLDPMVEKKLKENMTRCILVSHPSSQHKRRGGLFDILDKSDRLNSLLVEQMNEQNEQDGLMVEAGLSTLSKKLV